MTPHRDLSRLDSRNLEWFGLAFSVSIVLVVAVIRIAPQSMWLDEAYSRGSLNYFWLNLKTFQGTMILYYAVLKLWSFGGTATWWLRIPSLLAAIATLFVLRPIARRIGGSLLVAVALPATSFGAIFQWKALEMRAYSIEILITAITWYALIRALDETDANRAKHWWWTIAALSVLGIMTHGLFVEQLAPIAVVTLLSPRPRRALRGLLPTVVASAVTFGLFLVVGTSTNGTFIPGGIPVWIGSTLDDFVSPYGAYKLLVAEVLVIGAAWTYRRPNSPRGRPPMWVRIIPVAWLIGPWLALALTSVASPTFNPRYLAPIAPAYGLLVGCAAVGVSQFLATRPKIGVSTVRVRSSIAVVVIVTFALVGSASTFRPLEMNQDWLAAARHVAADARPGDAIAFGDNPLLRPMQVRPAFEASWQQIRHGVTPTVVSEDRPLGRARPDDLVLGPMTISQRSAGFRRVWLVGNHIAGLDHLRAISEEASFARFEKVGTWTYAGGIRVELWQRSP